MKIRYRAMQCVLVVLFMSILWSGGYARCFYGGTNNCQITCHCEHDAQCTLKRGVCPTGCRNQTEFPCSGEGCQWANVALGMFTQQSGTSGQNAKFAVDGGTNGMDPDTISNPTRMIELYWRVDLSFFHVVSYVRIYAVLDESGRYSISGVNVFVSGSGTRLTHELCGSQSGEVMTAVTITCAEFMRGRYVTIEQMNAANNEMMFAEVEVHGYRFWRCNRKHGGDYRWGPACLNRCEQCAEQCNRITGACARCITGWEQVCSKVYIYSSNVVLMF